MALHPNWKALSTVSFSVKQFVKEGQASSSNLYGVKPNLRSLNHSLSGEEARKAYEEAVGLPALHLQSNETQNRDFNPNYRAKGMCKEAGNSSNSSQVFTKDVPDDLDPIGVCVLRSHLQVHREYTQNESNLTKNNALQPIANEFLKAAEANDINMVAKFLCDGININVTDSYGWTALMCAACSGGSDVVKLLLKYKADINVKDKRGYSCLSLARRHRHQPVIDAINRFGTVQQICSQKQSGSNEKKQVAFYCEICKHNFNETSKQEHITSTVHQFNSRPKSFGTIYGIPEGNKGYQILLKGGWDKEKGLGPVGSGHKFPCKTVLKRDRTGLGLDCRTPRVTHFAPNDEEAVKFHRAEKAKKKKTSSKDREKHISRDKRKERELRIELS